MQYRIMQASESSFYVEHYSRGWFFEKWRPLRHPVGMAMLTTYFPSVQDARRYARDHAEFNGGSKVVEFYQPMAKPA